jgi:hypothetical protein
LRRQALSEDLSDDDRMVRDGNIDLLCYRVEFGMSA